MSTEYASAVAAVRAMESTLLTQADIDRLISAEGFREAAEILRSCSREAPDTEEEFHKMLDGELEQVWEFISGYVGDDTGLELLLYRNDFHDLKAALKALMMNTEAEELYLRPSNLDLDALSATVRAKRWDDLPPYMRECAAEVYASLSSNMDGQLADIIIDRACLSQMIKAAEKSGSEFLKEYAQRTAIFSDIKTAYRMSLMNKTEAFISIALCGTSAFDASMLARAAAAGTDNLLGVIESCGYGEAAELLKTSTAQFEKYCDDRIAELIEKARMTSFGIDPLAAYYIAKETEIRNLRIIFVCLSCGADKNIIKERMRMLYV